MAPKQIPVHLAGTKTDKGRMAFQNRCNRVLKGSLCIMNEGFKGEVMQVLVFLEAKHGDIVGWLLV